MPYSQQGAKWIRRSRRLALYIRDEFRCVYCQVSLLDASPASINLDHIDGTLYFGTAIHTNNNLATCCQSCNKSKNSTDITAWCDSETLARVREQTALPMARNQLLAFGFVSKARATKQRSAWAVAIRKAQAYCALSCFSQPTTASLNKRRQSHEPEQYNA